MLTIPTIGIKELIHNRTWDMMRRKISKQRKTNTKINIMIQMMPSDFFNKSLIDDNLFLNYHKK